MSFADKKGIVVASGFKLQAESMLDVRQQVDTIADRDELVTINAATPGLRVYVKATKKSYVYNGTSWDELTTGAAYVHPTGDGNHHVPATGTSNNGKVLMAGSTAGSEYWKKLSKSDISDFPSSMPTANSLVVKLNGGTTEGTNQFTFNGSAAKSINITPAAIGAAAASHGTHVTYGTDAPKANGTASAGSANSVSRSDHVHPAQTTVSGNAGSATKLQTKRTIDGVVFDGTGNIAHFGTCSTAAGTAAKVVSCTGFVLAGGAIITVKFTATNTAANPTLNVNNTGAKAIMYRGSAISAGYLAANRVYTFVYDGTDYELIGDINTDTNTTYGIGNTTTAGIGKLYTGTGSNTDGSMTQAAITSALNGKASSSHTHTTAQISNFEEAVEGLIPTKLPNPNALTFTGAVTGTYDGSAAKTINIPTSQPTTNNLVVKLNSGSTEGTNMFTFNGSAAKSINITPSAIGAAAASHSHGLASTTAAGFLKQLNGNTSYFMRADGNWAAPPNTTYSAMKGATSSAAGAAGLVPAPAAGYQSRWLRGDGTWQSISLSTLGVSATAAELNYMDGVTSNVQTQLNSKAASSHTHNYAGSASAGGAANSVKASLIVKLNGGTTEGTNMFTFNGGTAKTINITPSSIGAAASSHNHSAANITSGTLPVARGGTGITANPSLLVNLGSTAAAGVFATSPRPGVTGTLPVAHGGTGATSARGANYNLLSNALEVSTGWSDSTYMAYISASPSATDGALRKYKAGKMWSDWLNSKVAASYAAKSHSHSYLPLSGGTVTGTTLFKNGTYVHYAVGTDGKDGYVKIATIKITQNYQNIPIKFEVYRRGMNKSTTLFLSFASGNTSDPAVSSFLYDGAGASSDFAICKSTTSTWDLYIKKVEAYDNIGICEYTTNLAYMKHTITWSSVHANSLPSGAKQATYSNTASATNGSLTVQFNGSTKAIFNGGANATINITPAAIGAAASSHNHSAANITSGTLPVAHGGTGATSAAAARAALGAAAKSHTHNYAGSSSAGGVANSANRLNGISLTGGSGDTTGYRLIATVNINAWGNYRGVFAVNSRHTGAGLLCISVGCNNSPVSFANAYSEIMYFGPVDSGRIISPDSFLVHMPSNGSKAYIFWKYSDYNTTTIVTLDSDFAISNGTWMTSISTSTYGNRKATTTINPSSAHNHSASNITSGTLPVARGGTGLTSNPSMLTNLGSTTAASVFQASPRPGITGTLAISHGGTGATSASAARAALGAAAASHSHNYAGSSSAGGAATSAVKVSVPVGTVLFSTSSSTTFFSSCFGGTWTVVGNVDAIVGSSSTLTLYMFRKTAA